MTGTSTPLYLVSLGPTFVPVAIVPSARVGVDSLLFMKPIDYDTVTGHSELHEAFCLYEILLHLEPTHEQALKLRCTDMWQTHSGDFFLRCDQTWIPVDWVVHDAFVDLQNWKDDFIVDAGIGRDITQEAFYELVFSFDADEWWEQ